MTTKVTTKVTIEKWNKSVSLAKELLERNKRRQIDIAKIALQVCEITWGGRSQVGCYTMKRFANETGINESTLSNWICVYRTVYEKLPVGQQNTVTYNDMCWVANKVNSNDSIKLVRQKMNDHLSMDTFQKKIATYVSDLRAIALNYREQSAAFKVDDWVNNEILFYCEQIIFYIKQDRPKSVGKLSGKIKKVSPRASKLLGLRSEKNTLKPVNLSEDNF